MKYLYVKYFQEIAEIEADDWIEACDIGQNLPDSCFDRIEVEDSIEEGFKVKSPTMWTT